MWRRLPPIVVRPLAHFVKRAKRNIDKAINQGILLTNSKSWHLFVFIRSPKYFQWINCNSWPGQARTKKFPHRFLIGEIGVTCGQKPCTASKALSYKAPILSGTLCSLLLLLATLFTKLYPAKEKYESLTKKQVYEKFNGQLLSVEEAKARTLERVEKWVKSK